MPRQLHDDEGKIVSLAREGDRVTKGDAVVAESDKADMGVETFSTASSLPSSSPGEVRLIGTKGMFADLGHFNIRVIQLSFNDIVFSSVALCYIAQALGELEPSSANNGH
ncbi:hypothetical protein ZWY2020_037985 [Hordeum vulgare]|nr:hypothetical protein ZWY2020_037985 [Hordeum vulgare]